MAEGKYDVVRWYLDEGISGAESAKRKGFQQLIQDATGQSDFEMITRHAFDRRLLASGGVIGNNGSLARRGRSRSAE